MVGANFFHLCPSIDGCYNDISCSEQREMIFLNLLLDSKESATFLLVVKHFEKLISYKFSTKKELTKLRSVGKPRVGRAKSRELFKARAICHFLATRLRAIKKLYEATLTVFDAVCRHNWHIYGKNVWSKVQSLTMGRLKLFNLLSKGLIVQGCSI